jgi:sugar O-acyltransferase (sialic acid O-acetyltransferase NeuD family)
MLGFGAGKTAKNQQPMVSPRGTESAPIHGDCPSEEAGVVTSRRSEQRTELSEVSRIIIVGAGGFGREVLQWARDAWPEYASRIAGFLSAERDRLICHDGSLEIIGDPESYEPQTSDALLLAIGIPIVRRQVAESLMSRGAKFLTLVHPTAIVAPTAAIGEGAIICPYAIVSDSARVGAFVLMNYHSSLGHDASAGDHAVLSPYATLGGNAHIGDDVFMGLHASVGPGKRIGARSKVSANSCALSDAPTESIIYGAPGRVGPLIR